MSDKLKDLRKIYDFLASVYPGNWQSRWSKTPYMATFASQDQIDEFVTKIGKFESLPGHVWSCVGLWMQLRTICPNLSKLIDTTNLYERLWIHDIGETRQGDISLATKIDTDLEVGKDTEKDDYIKLVKRFDSEEREQFIKWFDDFESEGNVEDKPVEVLVGRWLDNIQGDHFALTFGNDLPEHSTTIEKIVKKRSAARSRELVDYLRDKEEIKAAEEVEDVMRAHLSIIREAGIKIDLSDLGF